MALFEALGIVNRTNNNLPHEADILSEGKKKINKLCVVLYNQYGEVIWNLKQVAWEDLTTPWYMNKDLKEVTESGQLEEEGEPGG